MQNSHHVLNWSTLLIYFLQHHLKAFCSKFSAATENIDYVSSGPNLFVNFVSSSGSYSGSSIYYWAIYDFHESTSDGEKVIGTRCDETLTIHNNPRADFNHQEILWYSRILSMMLSAPTILLLTQEYFQGYPLKSRI